MKGFSLAPALLRDGDGCAEVGLHLTENIGLENGHNSLTNVSHICKNV